MATRIHNFSYSGSTGLLTFVPCTGTEKACKVYVKHIKASLIYNPSMGPGSIGLTLNSKAADGTTILPRGWWLREHTPGVSAYTIDIDVVPSCNGAEVYRRTDYLASDIIPTTVFMPEYFYLKPNDTLTMAGYSGTFHIELMGISED